MFTAVIQPPLILFCAVPGAYWLFHGGKVGNLKDLLINCGYPLIERFPLMLGTAGGVLLIGLIRWYFGLTHRTTNSTDDVADAPSTTETPDAKSVISGIAAKLASVLGRDADDEDEDEGSSADAERVKAVDRRSRPARGTRSAQRPARSRSRHSRAPLEQDYETPAERRRRGSRRARRPPAISNPTSRPVGRAAAPGRRHYDPNAQPPREMRRDSYGRRSGHERPNGRGFDPYADVSPYESYEPYEPPRRRAPNGAGPTHHPISQVRYRGSASRDERREPVRRRAASRAPESIAHTGSVPGPAPD